MNIKAKVNRAFNSSMEVCGVGTAWGCLGGWGVSYLLSTLSPLPAHSEPWWREQSSGAADRARRLQDVLADNL